MLMYCKKCGRIVNCRDKEDDECDCCGAVLYEVPTEFLIEPGFPGMKKELRQQFIEEYVKTSTEFNQELFDQRDDIMYMKTEKELKILAAYDEKQNNIPRCPTCGSTNISKIGTLGRALSVSFFGLASNKIGKTHKCNNCGTTW